MTATEGGWPISKPYQGLVLQQNFLDVFYTRWEDFSMPPPSSEDALFVITPKYEKATKTIELMFEKGKPIDEFMSAEAKQKIGLSALTDQQWADFNAWLDPDKVLAPGDQPH
jgi:hypothetical protein